MSDDDDEYYSYKVAEAEESGVPCKWCFGRGRIYVEARSSYSYPCSDCAGSGYLLPEPDEDVEPEEEVTDAN